jgi:uncharacterized membrane protein
MDFFARAIQANPLAAIVLAALIMGELIAFAVMMQKTPIPIAPGWHTGFLAVLALLGFPAILDLLQTGGVTVFFAAVILVVLVLNIVIPLLSFTQTAAPRLAANWQTWAIPVLVVAGLVVASYLTYVEITATAPVCGPAINGCHLVQASPYAKLFGFLPVGVVGLAGYIAILIAWFVWHWGPTPTRPALCLANWALCFFGVLFSAYLTYLELFVIKATCVWCITSAVLMLLLLWVSTPAAQAVFVVNAADDDAEA